MKKLLSLFSTVAVLAVIAAAYWWVTERGGSGIQARAPGGLQGVVVEAADAIRATSVRKLKAIGTLTSNQSVMIRPEIAGRLIEVHFQDGLPVAVGDPIATLDKSVLSAELASAEASQELARQEYQRSEELLARGAGTAQRRDESLAGLRSAEAAVDLARAQLDKCDIVAPFGGVLGIREVDVGDYLTSGDVIVNIEQIAPIKVDFEVPERFLTDLVVGKELDLRSDAYAGEVFAARIGAIDPRINPRTRSVRVRARAENADRRLRPGQFVSVTLRVDERLGATFVPEQALVPSAAEPYVFRVVDGVVERVPVTTGSRIANHVEILSGIEPGDLVVTAGQQRLGNGAQVIAKESTFVPPSPPDEEIQVVTQ
ncbi:MAG: efflux RND transporter periplasmic adaptor subunit [Inquilinus sp.]|nr:efflux RND transporter periplasmic adaptor subunit [Inquilinus sp.]